MDPNQIISVCFTIAVFLLQIISIQQQQAFAFFILYQRCVFEYRTLLSVAYLRRRRRRLRRMRVAPYAWTLLRPADSWFDVHYNDPLIPQEYFRQQLRVNKATFVVIRNILGPRLQRQNSKFRDCLPPEKVLALGLYRLAHGNSYLTIAPVFNVGKSTVIDCDCVLLYSFSSEVPALCDCVRS